MKTGTSILWLLLIWFISILGFSFFFTIYIANVGVDNYWKGKEIEGLILGFIWGVFTFIFAALFSIPPLLWFILVGIVILKSRLHVQVKKILLVLSNYIGIGASSAIAILIFVGIAHSEHKSSSYILHKILTFYPTWSIVVLSTLCILCIPLTSKTKLS